MYIDTHRYIILMLHPSPNKMLDRSARESFKQHCVTVPLRLFTVTKPIYPTHIALQYKSLYRVSRVPSDAFPRQAWICINSTFSKHGDPYQDKSESYRKRTQTTAEPSITEICRTAAPRETQWEVCSCMRLSFHNRVETKRGHRKAFS